MILDESSNVEVYDEISNIDTLLSMIEKANAVCIFADEPVIDLCNRYLKNVPPRTVIIPVVESAEHQKKYADYNTFIHISDSKSVILNKIAKAVDSLESAMKKDEESKPLTDREKVILQYVAKGLTTKKIAGKLNISEQTVSSHRKNICNKLEIKSASGLTAYAIINGLIDLHDTKLR